MTALLSAGELFWHLRDFSFRITEVSGQCNLEGAAVAAAFSEQPLFNFRSFVSPQIFRQFRQSSFIALLILLFSVLYKALVLFCSFFFFYLNKFINASVMSLSLGGRSPPPFFA
jgi:hypothetical protein